MNLLHSQGFVSQKTIRMIKNVALLPFSALYGLGVNFRNFLYDTKLLKSVQFEIPIISVGNITVGGTGKTPHIEMLIRILKQEHKIAVLSRGYKRNTKGYIETETESAAETVGDELLQVKRKFPDIIVAADENRVRGVKKLRELHPEITLILLDDAFQHRRITPGLSILLIDFNRPIEKDRFLPYGNLRDSKNQIHRAHVIIVTKAPKDIKPIDMRVISQNLNIKPYQTIFFTGSDFGLWKSVYPNSNYPIDIERIKSENWHILAFAGIASPESLQTYARTVSKNVQLIAFPDHHAFTQKDIEKITDKFKAISSEKKILLTTEKDAVRLTDIEIKDSEIRNKMYYVPIQPTVINQDKTDFSAYIKTYIRNAQNDYKFYSTYNQNFGK